MTLKEKLQAIIKKLLASSRIPKVYAPIIADLVNQFMNDITDEELRTHIIDIQDNFLPWLLDETETEKII